MERQEKSEISLVEEFLSKGHALRNSKEEKERQNEELVHEMCSDSGGDFSMDVTPKRSAGACFIDASSLYDESETFSSSSRDSSRAAELEKRQGYFIFKNSINQYSGHPIGGGPANKDEDDFEIVDYPEMAVETPQNSLAYVPDDEGRVEGPAPIYISRKSRNPEVGPVMAAAAAGGVVPGGKVDSPALRRRTEMCPILSGGSVDVEEPVRPKKRSSSVSSASWIIDFSDKKTAEPKPSLNYYESLEEKRAATQSVPSENPKSLQLTKSTGFFIDLSEASVSGGSVPPATEKAKVVLETKSDSKKNIFSMFIDFDEKTNKKPKSAPRLSSSFRAESEPKSLEKSEIAGQKAVRALPFCFSFFLLFQSQNVFQEPKLTTPPSKDDDNKSEDAETTSSLSSSSRPERRRRIDAQINETFDKSSVCSLTDGILSKDLSPVSTTDEPTYQRDSDGSCVPVVRDDPELSTAEMQSAMDSITAAAEKQKQLLETPTGDGKKSEFVKLSDLDKPRKFHDYEPKKMSASADVGGRGRALWAGTIAEAEDGETTMVNLLASSVENSRSLSRLFPHLNDGG